jgi:SAM-dependent methyltransferase
LEDRVYTELYELEERHWWFRGRRCVIRALIGLASLPPEPEILDAGCGTGANLVHFGPLGRARGVDPSAEAVEYCRRRGLEGVSQARLEALPFDDASFDLLLACDVLEHIEDDDGALRELRRVARRDGTLLITVPAYEWMWSEHDDRHHHLRRYTLRRLRARAAGTGWRPVLATYFNSLLLPPIAGVRMIGRLRRNGASRTDYDLAPRALNRALELPMAGEARLIARGARLPAGVSIGMLCTRA